MPDDKRRLHRLLAILTHIQAGGGWTVSRLAETFGVSERTIYRDIAALRAAGIPCELDDDGAGGYRARREVFMPPVELTGEEALALAALGTNVAGRTQIPLLGAAHSAIAKVRCNLPADIQDAVDEVAPHMEIDLAAAAAGDGYTDVYERVREAIRTRRALACRYESVRAALENNDEADVFEFCPYTLFYSQRAWYAVGHHGAHQAVRCLKLNRFTTIQATHRPFTVPDGFSLRAHLGNAWRMIRGDTTYEVELRFDAAFAETVADTCWHETQEVELDDATGELTFRCTVDGLDEIKWWVLSMGPHCVVERPHELAREIEWLARACVLRYQDGARRSG